MSDSFNDEMEVSQDELAALKARADLMGVSYHPSIGLEKLRAKVADAIAGTESEEDTPEMTLVTLPAESDVEYRNRKRKEASELIRIRISCMNPQKKDWDGEIFSVSNSLLGNFTKYVPFNADEGWHVPRIIYNQLVERKCQIFVNQRDTKGNMTRVGKTIKEFSIDVLPQLTEEELNELAQRQAMSNAID